METETKYKCEVCNRTFANADGLASHNSAKHSELIKEPKKPFPFKKIKNWVIFILILGLIVWGIYSLITTNANNKTIINESELNFEVPEGPIHWHPHLTIKINGENYLIPANIGLSGTEMPVHTHDASGIIHLEISNPTKKTLVLGYFFQVWGKRLSKDCIFDYCTDKGTLKMYINGKENFEFQNYFMQEGDEILIEYTSN